MNRVASASKTLTKRQKWTALAIAAASDALQMALFPVFVEGAVSPWEIGLDAATAVVILLICGFQWRLAIALALELVPAVDLFPTWTALVLTLPSADPPPPQLPPPPPAEASGRKADTMRAGR